MANNINVDFSVSVGEQRQAESYLKVMVGKGNEEVNNLRKQVEQGTGTALVDSDHCLTLHFGSEDADPTALVEALMGMAPGEAGIESMPDKDGRGQWVQAKPRVVAGDEYGK